MHSFGNGRNENVHRQAQTLVPDCFKWSSGLSNGDYCQTIYPTLCLEQCFNLAGTQTTPFCSRETAQLLTCVSDHKGCWLSSIENIDTEIHKPICSPLTGESKDLCTSFMHTVDVPSDLPCYN